MRRTAPIGLCLTLSLLAIGGCTTGGDQPGKLSSAPFRLGISTEDLRKEFLFPPFDNAIVEDAMVQDVARNGGTLEILRENTVPIVVHFRDKRCVVIWFRSIIGGKPAYCYRNQEDTLIEVHDFDQ
jgi:hypothetical protein